MDTREVGDSVLARAMQPAIKPINRWDLVQDAFGATSCDPALTKRGNRWVAEALLDAQPAGGWRRLTGTVLTRATALNRLAATRLGIDDADDSPVDAAALLQWTTDAPAVASFLRLRDAERDGPVAWLGETAGPVAEVVFGMAATGKIPTRSRSAWWSRRSTACDEARARHAAAVSCSSPGSAPRNVTSAAVRRHAALQALRRGGRIPRHPVGRQRARVQGA